MTINIVGLDHIVLRVRDLKRMRDFYCRVLGCRLEREVPDIGLYQLRAGGHLIDLVPVEGLLGREGGAPPGEEGRNLDHFCLRIEPFEVDSILAHLRSNGVKPEPPALRYGAEGEGPSIYFDDPEGNRIELKGPPGPLPR